jgi:hypothetical protein
VPVPGPGGAAASTDWTPSLEMVAAHVPLRTIPLGDLDGAPLGTFNTFTLPTADQVNVYILTAVEHIEAALGTAVDLTLVDLATMAAAVRAAADVELAQPAETFDQRRYDQLVKQADALLARLTTSNQLITGTSALPGAVLMPVGSFPEPVEHGDWNL